MRMSIGEFERYCYQTLTHHWEELGEDIRKVDIYYDPDGSHYLFAVDGTGADVWHLEYLGLSQKKHHSDGTPLAFLERFFCQAIADCLPEEKPQTGVDPMIVIERPSFHELANLLCP